jgi:hypothetical protein
LKIVEFCCFQLIDVEPVAVGGLKVVIPVEVRCSLSYKIVYRHQFSAQNLIGQTTRPRKPAGVSAKQGRSISMPFEPPVTVAQSP